MKKRPVITSIISLYISITTLSVQNTEIEYPTPEIYLSLENNTNDNFTLIIENKKIAEIIEQSITKDVNIPLKKEKIAKNFVAFEPKHELILKNNATQNPYFINIVINKSSNIKLNITLKKLMSPEEEEKYWMDKFQISTQEALSKKIIEMKKIGVNIDLGTTKKTIKEFAETIKADPVATQDGYKIEIILNGDDLEDTEIDYIASLK